VGDDANAAATARRAAAARVSRDFAVEDDLATLLAIAQHGLGSMFNGECTIQLEVVGDAGIESAIEWLPSDGLAEAVLSGLVGPPSVDVLGERTGVLLQPSSTSGVCRAWVQFDEPRRVGVDEVIAGDLFTQAFAIAMDRIVGQDQAAKRESQLREAIDSHRIIGQATGIMMERHRLTAGAAFELLRSTSQDRNMKLRILAERLIETGQEPDLA
jgi:hypothetical protein